MPLPGYSLGEQLNIIAEKICLAIYISLRTIWGHENKGKDCFQNLPVPTCGPSIEDLVSARVHLNRNPPFSKSRIMDVLRAEIRCFTQKSCQRGVLWVPRACALFQQPSNEFHADKILPLPPKLINFSKEPLLLRSKISLNLTHPYKLLNGNGYRRRW